MATTNEHASSTGTTNEEGSSNGAGAPMSPNNESTIDERKNTPEESKEPKKVKDPKIPKAPKENNTVNEPKQPLEANGSNAPTVPEEYQDKKGSKAAKSAKVKAPKAPKPPKAPEKTFPEKLGGDLADSLVKDPRLFANSLNLVDRVSFVKLPQAAAIQAVEEEEDDSPDSSLVSEFQAAGETVQQPSKEEKRRSKEETKMAKEYELRGLGREIFDLHDFTALASLQDLICQYGRVSHMGILDKSYIFFITKDRKAALYYKIKNKVAVVGGDPLCPPHLFPLVLKEFEKYRKKWGLGLAFLGAGQTFVDYALTQKYTTMCFAFERVLNPMTNPVLHSNAGKSITRITRNLLDPKKDGLTLHIYTPALGKNAMLQQQLVNVYEAWRNARNDSGRLRPIRPSRINDLYLHERPRRPPQRLRSPPNPWGRKRLPSRSLRRSTRRPKRNNRSPNLRHHVPSQHGQNILPLSRLRTPRRPRRNPRNPQSVPKHLPQGTQTYLRWFTCCGQERLSR
jgi:hypothetical protein